MLCYAVSPAQGRMRGIVSETPKTIVVVPVGDGELQNPLVFQVNAQNFIMASENQIYDEFRMRGFVNRFFRSGLDILPLSGTPTMTELRGENLATIRTEAYRKAEDFPAVTFLEFFSKFYVEGQQEPPVHFLVWLPPSNGKFLLHSAHSTKCDKIIPKGRFPPDTSPAVDWYISMTLNGLFNFENATMASRSRGSQKTFKDNLIREYDPFGVAGTTFDMATGIRLPTSTVIASHIFQYKWRNELPRFPILPDINDVQNGLLLYKPVEWAFDRAKICVEVKPGNPMTFRLLDQDLRDVQLTKKACELRNTNDRGDQNFGKEKELTITFGDLDGAPLKFQDDAVMRPSKRFLGMHAIFAQMTARRTNPSRAIADVEYDTSGDETVQQAVNNFKILQWRTNVQPI
jgi:hypothetical protein